MPVQYEGVAAEHEAVRTRAGMFDVSHMGQIKTSGPEAAAFLQRLVSNDVTKLAVGGAQYSCLCADDGGILDDLFSYLLEDGSYWTVSNACQPRGRPRPLPRDRRDGLRRRDRGSGARVTRCSPCRDPRRGRPSPA